MKGKWIWYPELYVGAGVKNKQKKTIDKIKKGKLQPDIFVLTVALNGKNLIDIYPSVELKQTYYQLMDLVIIGIARGREEAMLLSEEIIMDIYTKTGGFELCRYLAESDPD